MDFSSHQESAAKQTWSDWVSEKALSARADISKASENPYVETAAGIGAAALLLVASATRISGRAAKLFPKAEALLGDFGGKSLAEAASHRTVEKTLSAVESKAPEVFKFPWRYESQTRPITPEDILGMKAADKLLLGASEKTDAPLLRVLAEDQNPAVRLKVALNPSTPPEAIKLLVKDAATEVRLEAAWNPSNKDEILTSLAKDAEPAIRKRVAAHPASSPGLLRDLADDPDAVVRRVVASNRNTDAATLQALAGDEHPLVARSAQNNPSFVTPQH